MSLEGTIIKGVGGSYSVDTGEGVVECRARGKFRKNEITPTVGDKVTVKVDLSGKGSIEEIHERQNFLIRPPVSNIDTLIIVAAVSNPLPDTFLIDKMLVIAEEKGIKGAVCINKSDLDESGDVEKLKNIYEKAGYKVFVTSAAFKEGIDKIKEMLKGKTTAFAGLSGVGKSSLLTLVTGRELETGDTSRIGRGKHTTRHVELLKLNDGYVLDTPGFSQLEITDVTNIKANELSTMFPEFNAFEGSCRFRGCSHRSEPGCSVKKALENGEIAQSRYDSYVKMYDVLKDVKDWERK
ncbi:MAG: ribosome small subunit-dependent GTPase A [Clostridia bacterium]